ncbi:MAG: hypothetical protein ACKVOM_09690 [Ferruginibacter sp.]
MVRQILTPAIASFVTGIVTKILTKKASNKAEDIFDGVVKKKVKDIFGIHVHHHKGLEWQFM